ncbi:MAG TPA: YciI family protein [Caulobacteraceae bacterium]|jgi:uncharacterized protein YciI|nr:YciI family protein [Caulobacteraceae bacterium]
MPYFMFFGSDGPNGKEIRARVRATHQAYVRTPQPGCRPAAAGVLVDDDGEGMNGSLLIFEADDRAAVERFVGGDPYAAENLFERTEIRRWNWVLGAPAADD